MKLNAPTTTTIFFSLAVAAALGIAPTALALKETCIESAEQLPLTIYEAAEMSPQNMDYDVENNVSTVSLLICVLWIRIFARNVMCLTKLQKLAHNLQSCIFCVSFST